MSKINAFRIINLNYNNNTMRIDDELFHLNGESTLMSLRNGGGKSVIVQVMMAPFVNKRYRDIKDREFSGYFTSNIPTYILVEWTLDGGASNVLTGMMVRKRFSTSDEDSKDDLEILNFVCEYRGQSQYDISHIPFVENLDGRKKVKSFGTSKQLFEELKKDKNTNFNYYDMNSEYQRKSYFDKLKEYKINYKEWESIIRRLNLKESGLSDMFTDSKNVNGLVEKWFLKTVEEKLNKDEDKVKNFGEIVLRYVKQYKENKSKIDKREAIEEFFGDAENIKNAAEAFRQCIARTSDFENTIANLIQLLIKNQDSEVNLREEKIRNIDSISSDIRDIQYEELSLEIYKCIDEKEKIEKLLEEIASELDLEKKRKKELEYKRNILECAKIYKEYQDFSREVQELENEKQLIRKQNKDFGPERINLGYTLKIHYSHEKLRVEETIKSIENKIMALEVKMKTSKENLNALRGKLSKLHNEIGGLNQRIESFNEVEEDFNRIYRENFSRNITGYYDNGALADLEQNNIKSLDGLLRKIGELKMLFLDMEEEKKARDRELRDKELKNVELKASLENLNTTFQGYDEEITVIKDILKYIEFPEEKVFDKEEIIEEFNKKIDIISDEALKLNLTLKREEEELSRLQSGKILELSADMAAEFQKRDIHVVYGMEWMKKNSYSKEENESLLRNNPFIPYCLIMNSKDLEKLEKDPIENFTSYPIIIVQKDSLEAVLSADGSKLLTLGRINFLISFNNKLIDEEGLKTIIEDKEKDISILKAKLIKKQEELKFYEGKRNEIAFSKLDKKKYFDAKKMKKAMEEEAELLENELFDLRKTVDTLKLDIKNTDLSINAKDKQSMDLKRKIDDFKRLTQKYSDYCSNKSKKESLVKELQDTQKGINEEESTEKNCSSIKSEEDGRRRDYLDKAEKIKNKSIVYEGFREGTLVEKDIEDIEARYESLTKTITDTEKNLEDRLSQANKRFIDKETELISKQNEYGLIEKHYKDEQYDNLKERQLKQGIMDKDISLEKLNKECGNYGIKKALEEQNISNYERDLKSKFDMEKPKARQEIKEFDFEKKIRLKEHEKKELQAFIDRLSKKISLIQYNNTALAQFTDLPLKKEVELTVDYDNLDKFRGELIRDYTASKDACTDSNSKLNKEIGRLLRKELFLRDDFFKKPLDKLEELSSDPEHLLENLNITIGSYKSLMEKLSADIELINKEKGNVMQSLFDYVREVHENIGKIDRNSSINVSGRSIKMLRILLPEWEDNAAMYQLKLNDMLDRVTAAALERLNKNENVEEVISTEITTKNLYNEVVSISSIEVKLYKIEEEKEYPISWDEVAKNSGGEGFLSAFVILSSLLSYMRRDDTDIFAEKESSKVLVMDNPFAQTSSEHLLKPLIEIAKKSNTQLICLSGLGGDSIYNRFDNIYVLNLISSKLNGGKQFVKGDHIKGEDESETLISSNFKISEEIEQIDLF